MRALFWADCGAGVGLGHLARVAALAGAWRAAGHEESIVVPADGGGRLLAGEGAAPARIESFDAFVARCAGERPAVAVVDSYRLPASAGADLRATGIMVGAFDDQATDPLGAEVVIDGAPGAERRERIRRGGVTYLLGARFFPLRRALSAQRVTRAVDERVRRLVVTAGGEDVHGRLRTMIDAVLEAFAEARIFTVAVPGAALDGMPARVEVGVTGSPLDSVLADADVVVCGGGQTLVEAASLGTPAVAVLLGEDQRAQHAAIVAAGAALAGGNWTQREEELRASLAGALRMVTSAVTRRRMRESGRALLDGQGASRLAAALATAAAAQGRE